MAPMQSSTLVLTSTFFTPVSPSTLGLRWTSPLPSVPLFLSSSSRAVNEGMEYSYRRWGYLETTRRQGWCNESHPLQKESMTQYKTALRAYCLLLVTVCSLAEAHISRLIVIRGTTSKKKNSGQFLFPKFLNQKISKFCRHVENPERKRIIQG